MYNDMLKDTSFFEFGLYNPLLIEKIQNNPFFKFVIQNPLFMIKMIQKKLKEKERNPFGNFSSGVSMVPDPFGNLNINQINQVMNSSLKILNINNFINNNTGNKEKFRNSGISIDYKEKYKEQLSQLKNMGFTNEEANIQALKQFNGNIDNVLGKFLK